MKLALEIEDINEPVIVEIDARDRRAFERNGGKDLGAPVLASLKDLISAQPETYATWLAWHALVRRGKRTEFGTWQQFEARVISAPVADEEDALGDLLDDPTVKAI